MAKPRWEQMGLYEGMVNPTGASGVKLPDLLPRLPPSVQAVEAGGELDPRGGAPRPSPQTGAPFISAPYQRFQLQGPMQQGGGFLPPLGGTGTERLGPQLDAARRNFLRAYIARLLGIG